MRLPAVFLAMFSLAGAALAGEGALVRQYVGLTSLADAARFGQCGMWKVNVGADGHAFSGQLRLGSETFSFAGSIAEDDGARFSPGDRPVIVLKRPGRSSLRLSFSRSVSGSGVPALQGTLTDPVSENVVRLTAQAALYTAEANPHPPFVQTPDTLHGRYTLIFPPKSPDEQGLKPGQFPQAHGVGRMKITADGMVILTGRLADGTVVGQSTPLLEGATWALWARVYGGRGGLLGLVTLRDQPGVSDCDGTDLGWFKPANAQAASYPNGWPQGLQLDVLGSRYVVPPAETRESVFPGLEAPSAFGNAVVRFQGGELKDANPTDADPHTALRRAANINGRNQLLVLKPGREAVSGTLKAATGDITGRFLHNRTNTFSIYRAVVFQKQARAFGFFLSPPDPQR